MSKKRFGNVRDMMKEVLPEDSKFVTELEDQMYERSLVRCLADLRNYHNVSQEEVAKHLGCKQARISKLENGFDSDVKIGDMEGYGKAMKLAMRIVFYNPDVPAVEEIKYHAGCIKQCFDRLATLAEQDEQVAKGVAEFHLEALFNLANIVGTSAKRLRSRLTKKKKAACQVIRVEVSDTVASHKCESRTLKAASELASSTC